MQPVGVRHQQTIVLREVSDEESIRQTNDELSEVEKDLCHLAGIFDDVKITVKKDGENLTVVEAQVNDAAKAIIEGNARLSESQATKSNMRRLGVFTGTGAAIGLTTGIVISCFVPPVAGIVAVFITTLGGAGGGGMMSLR